MCKCEPGGDARPCYPSDLSDAAWAIIGPLMPARDPAKGGAARKYGDRLVLDGILFVLRSGCQWRMIPRDLLPWDAAYRWYRAWTADGTRDRIHDHLRELVRTAEGREAPPSAAVLDAQSIKSGEGGPDRGFDAGKKTTGRKRHLITDTLGLVLVVAVTSASVQDRPGGRRVLARLAAAFPSVGLVWADAGYANRIDSNLLNWAYEKWRLVVEIVRRPEGAKGFQVLPRRWVVERTFGWLVRNRRLARDYERLTGNSETMVKIAMIRLMATRLAGQSACWSNRLPDQAA
ncbi:IS5 family transposase [Streptomonospora salina]|uniref:Transposase n=1 Tax=Streptomonospora salina TaxID=104205 RepID=A0A841EFS3_9ACTN|nr:IS5 family transposase [Streptomonospora salina]MBB5999903.1 transposase [Streptomonospora salina]